MSILRRSKVGKVFRALIVLTLLFVAQVGLAGTLEAPALQEGKFVYRVPGGFIPDKLSERGIAEIEQAAAGLHYPFYIVFVERLPTQNGSSTDGDTERAIVGLADDWARDPKFDRSRSTLFLVSYGPGDRKYKMLPAPRWRTELGLESDALEPYTEIFTSNARRDPQTAITRMMAAFDSAVHDGVDPGRKAERAEAARREAEDAARREAMADALAKRRAAEAAERIQQTTAIAAFLGVLGLTGFGLVRRTSRIAGDREVVRQWVAETRAWITQARQRYYQFDENRERAPYLKEFGGRTAELYAATSKEIDAIIIGVEAVASLLDSAEARAKAASLLNRKPLDEAVASLERPVTFATGEISDKLFDPAEKTVEIAPSAFLADLSTRYDTAVRDWQALNESVTRSLELPDALFPHSGLDGLLEKARKNGIPERWLASHPLMGDPDADRSLYAKVNENRLADPYAYALQIDDLKVREATLASNLDRLIAALALARARRVETVPALDTVLHPDDDPQITLDAAELEAKRVTESLLTANDVEAVEIQAHTADELYAKTSVQIETAQAAIGGAPVSVARARAALAECRDGEARAAARAEAAAREHTDVAAVRNAVASARRYIESGGRDLARAEEKLPARRHLSAQRDAAQALHAFGQATVALNQAENLCAELDAARDRYAQRLAEMEQLQRDAERRIRRYRGSTQTIHDFRPPTWGNGPTDYGLLLGVLQQQQSAWADEVRQAERAYEAEQRRQREAEEAERQRHQQSLYSSSSSGSSSSDSGSSGGSFSSGDSGSSGGSW